MAWLDEQHPTRQATITTALDTPRGVRYLDYAGADRGFAGWLLVADALCRRRVGVSIFDLSDWAWRNAYDTGETPGRRCGRHCAPTTPSRPCCPDAAADPGSRVPPSR